MRKLDLQMLRLRFQRLIYCHKRTVAPRVFDKPTGIRSLSGENGKAHFRVEIKVIHISKNNTLQKALTPL